jgi:hypothetical protein
MQTTDRVVHGSGDQTPTDATAVQRGPALPQDPVRITLLGQLAYVPVTFVGVIYAAGFIIMTNVFARWKIPAIDLIRVRFLTAGLFYIVMTAAIIFLFFLATGCIQALLAWFTAKRDRWRALTRLELGLEASGEHAEQATQILARHRARVDFAAEHCKRSVYIFLTIAALTIFPIAILFFGRPPRARYVLIFFYGMYGGGLFLLGVLRLIQRQVRSKKQVVSCIEAVRWLTVVIIWFFGIDILVTLGIGEKTAEAAPFYIIFVAIFFMQLMFSMEPKLRDFAHSFVGREVFWMAVPIGMFMTLYLSMVTFAFQVYPSIPAIRGGGGPQCVDVEVAESVTGQEVSARGERLYNWHNGLVLLDDRPEVMHLTPKVQEDGSTREVISFPRPLVRGVRYHGATQVTDINFGDGWKQMFSSEFWRRIWTKAVYVRDFSSPPCTSSRIGS